MKLQHLNIGDRFEYEGQTYVKTGPLTAASELGGQRIIPRYATLRPLGVIAEASKPKGGEKLNKLSVISAFDDFYNRCLGLLEASKQGELEAARRQFLAALR